MSQIGNYILSVTAAAILIGLLRPLLDGKGAITAVGKMLFGVFLLFSVLKPLAGGRLELSQKFLGTFQSEAAQAVEQGQADAKKAVSEIISQQIQAYILDKAAQYDAALTIRVTLSEDTLPVPVAITVSGSISPYGKKQLQSIIADELGIAKEDQKWI